MNILSSFMIYLSLSQHNNNNTKKMYKVTKNTTTNTLIRVK